MAWRNPYAPRLIYASGYRAALTMARADLFAMGRTHLRELAQLQAEIEALRADLAAIRAVLALRPPGAPVH